jgi:putative endonuclease
MAGRFFVYILASKSRTLYVGVTRDLLRRVHEHKTKSFPGFTAKYRIDRLVHFEESAFLMEAIRREKELKGWRRAKKVALIERANPSWDDLACEWYDSAEPGCLAQHGFRRLAE